MEREPARINGTLPSPISIDLIVPEQRSTNEASALHSRCFSVVCVSAMLVTLSPDILRSQVRLTKEEALNVHFPGMDVERKTAFLTDEQQRSIQQTARVRVESKIVTYYVGRSDGKLAGTAFFETQTIRTMPATIMVVIDPDTTVRVVEVVAFYEPPDYMPPNKWLAQYHGRGPSDDLFLKRGIQSIAGATLTAQTLSDAVRRLLVTYSTVVAPGNRR